MGIGPGDEVLVQDYTFFATAMPLFQLGAAPVPVDVDYSGELDLDQAHALITPATKALVATHMWGHPQQMRRLRSFCGRHGIARGRQCRPAR
ncbi:dTDP-4-amino-4,6-dideoxygalactose transaminase [Lipingzhangella halophila]|uniref:dTDP-4-amino-4,6-dideoxygalactose transaminase n=1 Tax=Lipingzhangella halophila TaxID=1783352 RepID=A0A7W7RND4_9ACTN|nr:dTDP-4-amino-4,6-dideoxygalactose transaminase [Lipingzhangella halophila]